MNTKTVMCTKCKGHKVHRGQELLDGRKLNNYKKIQNGICFTCMGKGTLELTEDGRYIDIRDNGNILEYDKNGVYIGKYISGKDDYLRSKESLIDYMRDYIDELEYKKEDLLNIQKEYRRIANRSINIHNIEQCEYDLCDLYNFELAATEFVNWKNDLKFLHDYLLEVGNTIDFISNVKITKSNKELIENIEYDILNKNIIILDLQEKMLALNNNI